MAVGAFPASEDRITLCSQMNGEGFEDRDHAGEIMAAVYCVLICVTLTLACGSEDCFYHHFIDEETGAQRG